MWKNSQGIFILFYGKKETVGKNGNMKSAGRLILNLDSIKVANSMRTVGEIEL